MHEVTESVEKGQKEQEEQEIMVQSLQKKLSKAVGKLDKMESDMISPDELQKLEVLINKVTSKAEAVETKIEKASSQRQADVEAIEKRITENEVAIDEAEESLDGADQDIQGMIEIMAEVSEAQKGIVDEAVKKTLEEA